jgi:hypothetical protein
MVFKTILIKNLLFIILIITRKLITILYKMLIKFKNNNKKILLSKITNLN